MITAVDMVPINGRARSPMRTFANETLREVEDNGEGTYEVTGWPEGCTMKQLAYAFRNEAWSLGMNGRITVCRRGEQLFVAYKDGGDGKDGPTALEPDALYSARTVESVLRLKHGSVPAAVREGKLVATRCRGDRKRYRGSDVMDWLREGSVTGVRA